MRSPASGCGRSIRRCRAASASRAAATSSTAASRRIDGKIYLGAYDGRLIALDAKTGKKVWETLTVDPAKPYTSTGAPRIANGKVIIGNGGAEIGVRGYISAYDAKTGKLAWRFYTVPGDPSKPYENEQLRAAAKTWNGDLYWKLGGGTVWDGIAYDPKTNLVYFGTANGTPWVAEARSPGGGDNLFLNSLIAVNADTGAYAWHYQTTPAETWDYDATSPVMLADLDLAQGRTRVLMQESKNGFFYVLDAKSGKLISADPYTKVTWATHVDMATGRLVEVPEARFGKTGKPAIVQPGGQGAHSWHPLQLQPADEARVHAGGGDEPGLRRGSELQAARRRRERRHRPRACDDLHRSAQRCAAHLDRAAGRVGSGRAQGSVALGESRHDRLRAC